MQVMLWGQEMSVEKLVAEARDTLGSATVTASVSAAEDLKCIAFQLRSEGHYIQWTRGPGARGSSAVTGDRNVITSTVKAQTHVRLILMLLP